MLRLEPGVGEEEDEDEEEEPRRRGAGGVGFNCCTFERISNQALHKSR